MNVDNLFPEYCEGPTLAALVTEHLRLPERIIAWNMSKGWRAFTEASDEVCCRRSQQLVDSYIIHYRKCLEMSFVQYTDPKILSSRLQDWSKEIRTGLQEEFLQFSQCELEDFTRNPGMELMEKERAVTLKSVKEITQIGAKILTDILFLERETPALLKKPKSIAETIAVQELASYTESLIAGTAKRMQLAYQNEPTISGYRDILYRLTKKELSVGLHVRLVEAFGASLSALYEKELESEQLVRLYEFRNRHLYKTLHQEIYRPLQLKAVEWITLQQLP